MSQRKIRNVIYIWWWRSLVVPGSDINILAWHKDIKYPCQNHLVSVRGCATTIPPTADPPLIAGQSRGPRLTCLTRRTSDWGRRRSGCPSWSARPAVSPSLSSTDVVWSAAAASWESAGPAPPSRPPPASGPAGDVRREGGLDDTYKDMGFYCQNITTTALTDLADTSNMWLKRKKELQGCFHTKLVDCWFW